MLNMENTSIQRALNVIVFIVVLICSPLIAIAATGTINDYNPHNVDIQDNNDGEADSSDLLLSGAPADSVITKVKVYFEIRHTYPEDLEVWLTTYYDGSWHDYQIYKHGDLGGTPDVVKTIVDITKWNGASPNQTWYLSVRDRIAQDVGYIDFFELWVDYTTEDEPVIDATITIQPITAVIQGNTLSVACDIRNDGDATHSFGVGAEIVDGSNVVADLGQQTASSVSSGSTKTVTFTYTIPAGWVAKDYNLHAIVWSGAPSSSEWLDDHNRTFSVVARNIDASVAVDQIAAVQTGNSVSLPYEITNDGNVSHAFGVGAEIWKDGVKQDNVGSQTTVSVSPEGSTTGSFSYDIPLSWNGTYTARCAVWSGAPGTSTWLDSYDRTFIITSTPLPPITEGRIAWHSYSEYNDDNKDGYHSIDGKIYIYDFTTGSHNTRAENAIENSVQHAMNPNFSSDGRYLTFMGLPKVRSYSHDNDSWANYLDIFIYDFKKDIVTNISELIYRDDFGEFEEDPVFSPDGLWVAFKYQRTDIWKVQLSDHALIQITAGTGEESGPQYSPDGNWICFWHGDGSNAFIAKVQADSQTPVTNYSIIFDNEGLQDYFPSYWDETRIIYTGWDGNGEADRDDDDILIFDLPNDISYFAAFNSPFPIDDSDAFKINDTLIGFSKQAPEPDYWYLWYGNPITGQAQFLGIGDNGKHNLGGEYATSIVEYEPNEAPTDIDLSNMEIDENQLVNTTVGVFSAVDANTEDTFIFSLVGGEGSSGNSSFEIVGEQLRTLESFDYEDVNLYSMRVRATDQGGLWVEDIFTIAITDLEEDTDKDGIFDDKDLCPGTLDGATVDTNGCSESQKDGDNDGVVDSLDKCGNTPTGEQVNADGCSSSQIDSDGDGIIDDKDICTNTPAGSDLDTNGCADIQKDSDGDGIMNDKDICPGTKSGEQANVEGCSPSQVDTDKSFDWFEALKVVSLQASDIDVDLDGDIDGDGKISVKEAIYALQSASQIRGPSARAILSGPLAGANVSLYRLSDLELPVYQTQTDINGYFQTKVTGFPEDDVLLVKISGGFDTGAGEPVLNLGAIHTLISGSDWIKGGFFVSAITDLTWQYTKNLVGDTDSKGIDQRLNELANTFLKQAINGDSPVSKTDIFSLYPLDVTHRNALNFDYQILLDQNDDGLSIISCYHQNLSDAQALLLDTFFGDRLTRFPVADSQSDKVKLSVAVLGEGRVTASDNATVIDTASTDPTSNVVSTFYDPAEDTAVILTAVPTAETEILSWQGCDSISEDGTQCGVLMRSDHLVTLSFGYTETILDSTIQLVDLSEETVIVNQDGITLDVTLTSGNLSDLDLLGQGDVVVGSVGNGFLRRIVAINKQSATQYVLTTEDVALEEVISQGTGTLYKEMTHGDLAQAAAISRTTSSLTGVQTVTGIQVVNGVQLLPGESPDDRVFKFIIGDQSTDTRATMDSIGGELKWTDPDSGVELTLNGTIDVTIDVETGVSFNGFKLQDFTFIPRVNAQQSLEISVGGELETPKLEKTLASFKFQPITFFVGPVPVVVLPQVDLVIGIDAKIGAQVYTKINFTQMARAGIVYNRNAGLNVVKEFTLSYDFIKPTITGYAQTRPYIKGSPSMMIYGVTGPGVFLRGYLKLKGEAETPVFGDEACSTGLFVSSYAGMDAGFEWDLGLLKKVLGDWSENVELSVDLYKKEWLLRKWNVAGDCVQPPFLEVQGLDITKTVQSGTAEIISEQYILKNTGELPLEWEIGFIQDSAISASAHSGTLAENETTAITISIDTSELWQGKYRNTIHFKNLYDAGLLAGYSLGTTTRQVHIEARINSIGTVISATGRIWMDRNLGASRVAIRPTDIEAYGDLYQWGRGADGHQLRTSGRTQPTRYDTKQSSTDNPGHGLFIGEPYYYYISDWRKSANNNLWQGVSGINNPCPDGFRLPTITEMNSERNTWSSNDSTGAFSSPLKLVSAGYRHPDPRNNIVYAGVGGAYWTSGGAGWLWGVGSGNRGYRANGYCVRCIKDQGPGGSGD